MTDADETASGAPDPADTAADDAHWLAKAVELAVQNVREGGGPFGAVIVRDGAVIGVGQNRVTRDNDPTAHAEVLAIRAACAGLGDFSLVGGTLYTSCEPCPLCAAASLWARLDRIVYAADREDAAGGGFDDRAFYEYFAGPRSAWPTTVDEIRPANATAPFDEWLSTASRIEY